MHVRRFAGAAAAAVCAALLAVSGCSSTPHGGPATAASQSAPAGPGDAASALPFDVTPLLRPAKKYFGVALDKVPDQLGPLTSYTAQVGKQPNLLEYYAEWGAGFDASAVRRAWQNGSMTLMSWEPKDVSLKDIAAGRSDGYLRAYAAAVLKLNLPVVIDFADEFNGHWDAWGTQNVTPAEYVAAYRHMHDVFDEGGAANVIWAWSPNIVNPVPSVKLKPYYPGDAYVDWVGIVGYFTVGATDTFSGVFGPTVDEVRSFTSKPFIIIETASEAGRASEVEELFNGVAGRDDFLGFIWFNFAKRADWRLQTHPAELAEFKRLAADKLFGFDVRNP